MGKITRSKSNKMTESAATNVVEVDKQGKGKVSTPKISRKSVKRNLASDLDGCAKQPVNKRSKTAEKVNIEQLQDNFAESEAVNNNAMPVEVVVGTAKSLIDSIKKKKGKVHKGHEPEDLAVKDKPGTSGVQAPRAQKMRKTKSKKGTDNLKLIDPDRVDLNYDSEEDEYSDNVSDNGSNRQSEEDPDVSQFDLPPRQENYNSSSEELDYSEEDNSYDGSSSSQVSGDSDSDSDDDLREDPKVKKLLSSVMEEYRLKEKREKEKWRRRERELCKELEREKGRKKRHSDKGRSSKIRDSKERKSGKNLGKVQKFPGRNAKSPSDTTIYAPALMKDAVISPLVAQRAFAAKDFKTPVANVIDQISTFVENIRIRSTDRRSDGAGIEGRRNANHHESDRSDDEIREGEAMVES